MDGSDIKSNKKVCLDFYQKPYSKSYPYDMLKMAAVEPICFYPNRDMVKAFYNKEINMEKLTKYIYEKKLKQNTRNNNTQANENTPSSKATTTKEQTETSISVSTPQTPINNTTTVNTDNSIPIITITPPMISTTTSTTTTQNNNNINGSNNKNEKDTIVCDDNFDFNHPLPSFDSPYYTTSYVNRTPLINVMPKKNSALRNPVTHYTKYKIQRFEQPPWTKSEKKLFNELLCIYGKNFTLMEKEYQKMCTGVVVFVNQESKEQNKINGQKRDNKEKEKNLTLNEQQEYKIVDISNSISIETTTTTNEKYEKLAKKRERKEDDSYYDINDDINIDEGKTKKPKKNFDNSISSSYYSNNLQTIYPVNSSSKFLVYNFDTITPSSQTLPSKSSSPLSSTQQKHQQNVTPSSQQHIVRNIEDMIFPRKVKELVRFYYLRKFKMETWCSHNKIKKERKRKEREEREKMNNKL